LVLAGGSFRCAFAGSGRGTAVDFRGGTSRPSLPCSSQRERRGQVRGWPPGCWVNSARQGGRTMPGKRRAREAIPGRSAVSNRHGNSVVRLLSAISDLRSFFCESVLRPKFGFRYRHSTISLRGDSRVSSRRLQNGRIFVFLPTGWTFGYRCGCGRRGFRLRAPARWSVTASEKRRAWTSGSFVLERDASKD